MHPGLSSREISQALLSRNAIIRLQATRQPENEKEDITNESHDIITKLHDLTELRRMADDINAGIEALQDAIKAHMEEAATDTINAGQDKVTWKPITSTRIDTAALRKDLPGGWQEYGKTTTTRRFSVTTTK